MAVASTRSTPSSGQTDRRLRHLERQAATATNPRDSWPGASASSVAVDHAEAVTSQPATNSIDVQARHVLVPFDGSEFALAAMPTARALAERFAAELHTISASDGDADADRLRASASAALGVPVEDGHVGVVDGGDAAEVIARRAEELGDCVVCVSTHGRGRLSGAVIGSVARSLFQRSTSPIVALGPSADRPGWSPSPRWPVPLSVPRNGGLRGRVRHVRRGAPGRVRLGPGARDVAYDPHGRRGRAPPLRPDGHESRYGASADAPTYIHELVQRWAETAPEVSGHVVRDPISPASGIRTYLDQQPAGLVALTSHARSGVQRVLLGAAAANIVHASVSPCLVVPLHR